MTPSQSRTVRIFLSSTFRDFGEERDLLVRKVFPELRRRCRERQVTLVDVDLRWGITEAEAQQGKVLPICLAEIDHSRPYFIGLLGERYGWVPEPSHYAAELLERESWLAEHAGGKSVTELEVLHGVLNNPAMAGQALFYFRDPAYAAARGGDYGAESAEHRQKLQGLKERIRHSEFPVVEEYLNPSAVAERIGADLWRIIDAQYPLAEVPDALALERQRHDTYGASRLGLYLGGEDYLKALDEAHEQGKRLVLIRGASGGGKSALLANWLEAFKQQHPQTRLFVHHLGATNDAGEPDRLVRRWIQELARALGETAELPADPEKLFDELPVWIAKAASKGRWVMVLDALDKLRSGRDLRWLPAFLPEGVQLVVSCLDGEVLDVHTTHIPTGIIVASQGPQRRHPWERELAVEPLSLAHQRELVRRYLGTYRKSLTTEQEKQVLGHPLAGNPLFLRTVLEELRVHGAHEELDQRITKLLGPPVGKRPEESPTVDDVFEHVLERVEADSEVADVRQTMGALWASRGGLAQDELLAVTGMAPARWAGVQLGLEELLLESGGRWTFAHDYARKAVQDRYLPTAEAQQSAHRTLGEWFAKQETSKRVAEELPWQWGQAWEQQKLKECLTDRALFLALKARDEFELLGYWVRLGVDISGEYEAAWPKWKLANQAAADVASALGNFLGTAGYHTRFAIGLEEQRLENCRAKLGSENPITLCAMGALADSYFNAGRLVEALGMREEMLRLLHEKLGADHPDTLRAMNRVGQSFKAAGRLAEALKIFEEASLLTRRKLAADHEDTLSAMVNLAGCYSGVGREDEALEIGEEVLRLRREKLGVDHPATLTAMDALAGSYSHFGRLVEALGMREEALRLMREKLGADHPTTLTAMEHLASSYAYDGRMVKALEMMEEVLRSRRETLGADHPATLATMGNLADSYWTADQQAEALELREQALRLRCEKLGEDHPDTFAAMDDLANSYSAADRLEEALGIGEKVLRLKRKKLGADHEDTLAVIVDLAGFYRSVGREDEALGLRAEVLRLVREKWGADHEGTLAAMVDLADFYMDLNREDEALGMRMEVLRLMREKLGVDHEATLAAMVDVADFYSDITREEEAFGMREEVLRLMREKLGGDHQATQTAMDDFVGFYWNINRKEEALGMRELVLPLMREKLGVDHEATQAAMDDLACFYWNNDRKEEALEIREEVLRLTHEKLGVDHPSTLAAMDNLAGFYWQADREEWLGMKKEVLRLRREKLGEDHPDTLASVNNLASILSIKGDKDGAELMYRRLLVGQEKTLGPEHSSTLTTVNNLARLLKSKGDHDGAVPLYRRRLAGSEKAFGLVHPNTLDSV